MNKLLLTIFSLSIATMAIAGTTDRRPVATNGSLKQLGRQAPANGIRKAAAENAIDVPFQHALGKDSPNADYVKANYTVINANNDSRTWNVATTNKYSSCMAAKAGESEAADDWLITMPINMTAGNYILKFDNGFMGASASGTTLEVKLGTAPTVEGMTNEIIPATFFPEKDQTSREYTFSVPEDGVWYIGFHCLTTVEQAGAALLYSIGVEKAMETPANAVEVPFTHNLGKDSSEAAFVLENYKTINVNDDNRQWQLAAVNGYSACMAPNADDIDANDDWLITAPIHFTPGNYTVSFDLGYMSGTGVIMEVKMGEQPTAEGMTTQIVPVTTFTEKDQTTYQYNCTIDIEGYYYIGFHCLTTKDLKSALKLFSVGVSAGEVVQILPPAAGTITWELAPKGELKATVTYTAPTKTTTGEDLTEISKVEITSRWGVDKFTYENVTPGQVITIENVEMYQGINNRFTGVAYVGDVAGDMVEHKYIFCGKDTPLAPTNVTLTTNSDYTHATLSWDPVGEEGENGGYVDPEEVIYYIFDAFGSYYDPAIAQTSATSITLSYEDLEGQDFMAYQVTAGYGSNYSLDNSSNIAIVGTPAILPFQESFTGGYYDGIWALDPATSYGGQQYGTISDDYFASMIDPDDPDSPTPLTSFDGDNGFFYWLPYEKDVMFGLMSVRSNISNAINPVLEFRYQGQGSTIDVLLAGGTDELSVAKTINLQAEPTEGWTLARIPLSDYKAQGTVNFEVRLTANHNDDEHVWSVPLDYIVIRDLVDTDIRMVSGSSNAATTKPGETIQINARIQNQGLEAADAIVELYVNEKKIDEKDAGDLAPDSFADVTFEYTVPLNSPETLNMSIVAVAAGDAVAGNNSQNLEVNVAYPAYPTVVNLQAESSNEGVVLTWDAPTFDTPQPQTIFEDFENEDYTPMSISGAGGWTVYDGDKATTINVFYEQYNPYQTAPMAFQLFNREIAEVPGYSWLDAEPHSGNTFMLAPTAYYEDNDNWLISPELSGNAQTVTFYAKSYSIAWPESFDVRYSTTGNAYTDFPEANIVEVENYPSNGEVPETWELYKATLPAGAKHFAIHHTGWYTCALYVDDVTYEGMPDLPTDLAIEGYHVMRDDLLLTEAPVTATSFTDELMARTLGFTDYVYSVIPVYNHGIGKAETITVNARDIITGVETIEPDSILSGDCFYNLQGLRINAEDMTPGIYIRVRGDKSTKVIVK